MALGLCGWTAVVGQIVLMRELIQLFNGNEVALGVLLGVWLLWTAFGSTLASVLFRVSNLLSDRTRLVVAALECLLAVSLPATIAALRCFRSIFTTVPGEVAGPMPMLLTSLASLSVFCMASGALFAAATSLLARQGGLQAHAEAGTAYLAEAAGSALGGLLASIVFVRFLDAFQIAAVASLLNLTVAAALFFRLRRARLAMAVSLAAVAAVPLLGWIAPRMDAATRARLWSGFHVIAACDSVYGKLIATRTGDTAGDSVRSLYENGSLLADAPDPAAAEEAVDPALLEHPSPRRVLLIGGGLNGGVAEALKHPGLVSLDYVELDPALIGLARQVFPEQTAAFASDPRVHLHFIDGRRFLAETGRTFDVILVDVPDPKTAQLNRFYTVEFYRLARAHLAPGGLIAIQLRSSEEMISPDLAAFLRSIWRTLGAVFPYRAVLPGETVHFFGATTPGLLTHDPQTLVGRLRARHLRTEYISEFMLPFRMTPDRMEQIETVLAPQSVTPINRDFAPVAYGFDVLLWSTQFRGSYAAWFRAAARIPWAVLARWLAIVLLAGVALAAMLPGRERRSRTAAGLCVAATGSTLMALQIFLLLGFQAVYGYVYTELAILIGLMMAGIALGSWVAMRRRAASRHGMLAIVQLVLLITGPVLLLAMREVGALGSRAAAWLAAQIVFPALAALAGVLGGFQFVVAAGTFLRRCSGEARFGASGLGGWGVGLLYAIDLLGGCIGAFALSAFLLPVYGFWRTAWLVAGIDAAAFLLAVRTRETRTSSLVE